MWFENLQSVWASYDMIGRLYSEAFDQDGENTLKEALEASSGPDDPQTIVVKTKVDAIDQGRARTLKIVLRRVLNEEGVRRGAICSSVDITEEVRQTEIHRVLMLEVAHRSKNLLAMVLSLAAQTARSAPNIKSFLARFTGRIQSLAKSQDVITEMNWTGVGWLDLVRKQVTSVVPLGTIRISLEGDNLTLSPNASTHIGLALHELVSRSLAIGALSQPDGAVRISLEKSDDADASFAVMRWQDNIAGDGEACDNVEDNFSKTLLSRIVPSAVGGHAKLEVDENGLSYMLTIQKTDYN